MPIQFDAFSQQKVDRLKSHLEAMAAKGKPKFYEIYVDSMQAVAKTDEPSEFEGYEDYMSPDTSTIKILIYCSGASPRNEKYVFSMKAKSQEEALDLGLNGIANRSYSTKELDQLRQQRERKTAEAIEIHDLKQEVKDLSDELDEKEAYIQQLEAGIEKAKENGNKIGGMHVGEIVSVALEGLVRRNTHLIAQVPVLEGLAGIIDKDNQRPQPALNQPDAEVSFQKKTEAAPALSEQEKEFLALFHEIQRHFNEGEISQIIDMLEALSKDKTKMALVLDLLQNA